GRRRGRVHGARTRGCVRRPCRERVHSRRGRVAGRDGGAPYARPGAVDMSTSETPEIRLFERIGALQARMDSVERRVEKIDANVEKLAAAAYMGRGAWWAATKLGGWLVLMAGAAAWAWERLRPLVERGQG